MMSSPIFLVFRNGFVHSISISAPSPHLLVPHSPLLLLLMIVHYHRALQADELLTICLAQTAESKYVDDGKGEDPIVAGAAWATRMLRQNAWVMIQRSQIWIAR